MLRSVVCVDANVIVALITTESFSRAALALWRGWVSAGQQPAAPLLLRYEVASAVHRKALRHIMDLEDARKGLQESLELDILLLDPPELSLRAFELATRFQRPTAYDTHYMALAEHLNCPFWTADERLYNAVHDQFPLIRWLGHYGLVSSTDK